MFLIVFLWQIEGHCEDVNTVAFADGTSQILYSGGDDGLCKVINKKFFYFDFLEVSRRMVLDRFSVITTLLESSQIFKY